MERLTDKLVVNNKFAGYCAKSNKQCRVSNRNEVNDITNATEIINKCGKLEDVEEKHNMSIDEMDAYITEHKKIEKELGIDLITLFKALKNGVYTYEQFAENPSKVKLNIRFIDDKYVYFNSHYFVPAIIKDYGETWALTKEELEK